MSNKPTLPSQGTSPPPPLLGPPGSHPPQDCPGAAQGGAARAARTTRAKKATTSSDDSQPEPRPEPAKKPALKAVAKKTVTFEEPEKENIVPATTKGRSATKESETATASGPSRCAALSPRPGPRGLHPTPLRARNRKKRRPPAPLSPRKVTQIRLSREMDSEDELAAMEKTPLKKNPIRPLNGLHAAAAAAPKRAEPVSADVLDVPPPMLGSPARRPPPSPYKDAMKSPARKAGGIVAGPNMAKAVDAEANQPSLRHPSSVPAKRPQIPAKSLEAGSGLDDTMRSPFKVSLLQSPAKRPFSPAKGVLAPSVQPRAAQSRPVAGAEAHSALHPRLVGFSPPARSGRGCGRRPAGGS